MARRSGARALAVLTVALMATAACAARLSDPFDSPAGGLAQKGQDSLQGMLSSLRLGRHKKESEQVYVALKYFVAPSKHKDFIKEWEHVEKEVSEESGNLIYSLKKTASDNILFVGYGEWKSPEDLVDHLESKYVEGWLKYLADEDIVVKVDNLIKPTKKEEVSKNKEGGVSLLTLFTVEPSAQIGFVESWEETVSSALHTKGNRVYSLRKTLTDNTSFYLYSAWDRFEDFVEFLKGKDTDEFRDYAIKHDVIYFTSPLITIGEHRNF